MAMPAMTLVRPYRAMLQVHSCRMRYLSRRYRHDPHATFLLSSVLHAHALCHVFADCAAPWSRCMCHRCACSSAVHNAQQNLACRRGIEQEDAGANEMQLHMQVQVAEPEPRVSDEARAQEKQATRGKLRAFKAQLKTRTASCPRHALSLHGMTGAD